MSLGRRALEGAGAVVAGLLVVALVILVPCGGFHYRSVCEDRARTNVSTGAWKFSLLAPFASLGGTISRSETCEEETWSQYIVGSVPVVGHGLERTFGGPSNPDYYASR